ncbi:MAG: DUF4261 domain-containing protein [Lachnospiraceae bacterium]|nr:DUF4261 domain-containing protein [Lachnospiraceae bacterium]
MTEQAKAATAVMEEWLSHPDKLGKKPAYLEIAGEFNLHGLHYYTFKFKKSPRSSWKVAVCGGYEGDSLGHCGHIHSQMETYEPGTAQAKSVEMVEKICRCSRDSTNEEADQGKAKGQSGGEFLGFILLSAPEFDIENFRAALKEDWGIHFPKAPENEKKTSTVFEVGDMMVTVALMEMKVPKGEAEHWANNFRTREKSLAAAKNHTAHLLTVVLSKESAPLEAGKLFVKIASACLKADNALGIYNCGTVVLPEDFIQWAMVMKDEELPLMDLVYIGLDQDEKGVSSWSNGLRSFGREEVEIIESSEPPSQVYDLMCSISAYIIQEGADLRDGETLDFAEIPKLSLTLSKGVHVEGQSIKIKL